MNDLWRLRIISDTLKYLRLNEGLQVCFNYLELDEELQVCFNYLGLDEGLEVCFNYLELDEELQVCFNYLELDEGQEVCEVFLPVTLGYIKSKDPTRKPTNKKYIYHVNHHLFLCTSQGLKIFSSVFLK